MAGRAGADGLQSRHVDTAVAQTRPHALGLSPRHTMTALRQCLPRWARNYPRQHLTADLLAGLIVTVLVIPQSLPTRCSPACHRKPAYTSAFFR